MAFTDDLGTTWQVIRFWQTTVTAEKKEDKFYAYPNPFQTGFYNRLNGESQVRFVFSGTPSGNTAIDIFDFAMEKVIRLTEYFPAGNEYELRWNCRNDWGDPVANGVYFCRLTNGNQTYWTKLVVIND